MSTDEDAGARFTRADANLIASIRAVARRQGERATSRDEDGLLLVAGFRWHRRDPSDGDLIAPITKGIVEAHGGRIWVESALGRGSTFFFALARGDQIS